MAYFTKENNGDIWYSYYKVYDCIPRDFATRDGLQKYLDSDSFQTAVINSYESIDLSEGHDRNIDRVVAKMQRTGDWLRKNMSAF